MKISAISLKQGNAISYNGRVMMVATPPEHVKPGKGPAYIQLELRDVISKTKTNVRLSSSESVERIHVEQQEFQFLYATDEEFYFMSNESFEQLSIHKDKMDKAVTPFLQEGMNIKIEFFSDEPINLILPQTVILEIEDTEPVIKGATASASYKAATMNNGIIVKVPSYLSKGERIVVRTEDGSFVERVK